MKAAKTDRIVFTLFVIFFSLILGCKEDIPTEIIEPEKFIWNKHPFYTSDHERAYNLVPTEKFLKVYGERSISKINRQNNADRCSNFFSNVNYKLPASDLLYFSGSPHQSEIVIKEFACGQEGSIVISDLSSDSLFEYFEYNNGFLARQEAIGFDGEFSFLLPTQATVDHPVFYLVVSDTINFSSNYVDYAVELDTIARIVIEEEISTHLHMSIIDYINGSFWVSFSSSPTTWNSRRTYRINHDYTYEKVVDRAFQSWFLYNGELYGTEGSKLFKSNLTGAQWEEVKLNIPEYNLSGFSIKEIDGEIYCYAEDIIGKLVWGEDDGVRIDYFNNAGIEGSYITDIEKFQDKLYISTFSGIFWSEFEQLEILK